MAQPSRFNPARGLNKPLAGGGGFNNLAAGNKRYGAGGVAPNQGPVGNKAGYVERDKRYSAYGTALRNRILKG
jgi:hypothetical protein